MSVQGLTDELLDELSQARDQFGVSMPADAGSLGAATPFLLGGAWMVGDGADN